jgi:hypothetical protein
MELTSADSWEPHNLTLDPIDNDGLPSIEAERLIAQNTRNPIKLDGDPNDRSIHILETRMGKGCL